jgi:hypothetical protein
MIINNKKKNSLHIFIYLILFIFGLFISHTIKYGDDIDSHSLILSYLSIIEKGIYTPSRFYGSPLAEIIIGFFSYNLGGFISSFICYFLYLISIISIFNYSNYKNIFKNNERNLFLILAITNPVLLFDNLNPSDFILALFFFSTGILMLKSRLYFFSSIFLAFSIACRANFTAFVYTILFYDLLFSKDKINKNKFFVIINTSIIGALFYLPVFIQHKFGFDFIQNSGGPSIEIYELLPRFFYKIYKSLGIYNSIIFFILLFYINIKIVKKILIKFNRELLVVLINLIIFFLIPTKTAIITLAVLFFYIIILKVLNTTIIFLIILLNVLYWIVGYKIINISYKNLGECDAIQAKNIDFNFQLEEGFYLIKKEKIKVKMKCDSFFFKNKKNYLDGKKLSTNDALGH